jgi:hypothetical protein
MAIVPFLRRIALPLRFVTVLALLLPGAAIGQAAPVAPDALVTAAQGRGAPQGNGCVVRTLNPGLDDAAYLWDTFLPQSSTVLTDDKTFFSPPLALRLSEQADRLVDTTTGFDDAFGQGFTLLTDTKRIRISFNAKFDPATASGGDQLYYALYTYRAPVAPGQPVQLSRNPLFSSTVTPPADSNWFAVESNVIDARLADPANRNLVLLIATVTDGTGPDFAVWVDDVQASACDTVGGGTISGVVIQSNAARNASLRDAQLLLTYTDTNGEITTYDRTAPSDDGVYAFSNVPVLSNAGYYQVWFQNDSANDQRLDRWAGPKITSVADGQNVVVERFDISDVDASVAQRATPRAASTVSVPELTLPATFTWTQRAGQNERYRLCVGDLVNKADVCTEPTASTSATLTAEWLGKLWNNGFAFAYNKPYQWYVQVIGSQFDGTTFADSGFSYETYEAVFVQAPRVAPVQNTSLVVPSEQGVVAQRKKWTVLLYLAGDNDLSSPIFTDNLRDQYASLQRLARTPEISSTLNIVTLSDFDEDGDTRLCNLTSATDCPVPAEGDREKDTANPLVLTNFISATLAASQLQADHYMLIMSSHAHMVNGMTIDETTLGAPSMSPRQLREAISAGLAPSGKKLDVLFYYACLMGGVEAAFDASFNANYLVASADQVWVVDFYEQLLGAITRNAGSPRDVAKGIVAAYQQKLATDLPGLFTSIAAYDLARVAPVRTALSSLADALRANPADIDAVRGRAQLYDSSGDDKLDGEDAFADLRDVALQAQALRQSAPATDTLKTAANNLLQAIDGTGNNPLIIATAQVSGQSCAVQRDLSRASGLAVYFPSKNQYSPGELNTYRREYAAFNTDHSWDDLVVGYVSKSPTRAPGRPSVLLCLLVVAYRVAAIRICR